MVYPSAVQGLRDTLAKDCFIESLNDVELEMFVCQKEPDILDDAVRVALKRDSYDESDVTSNDIREIKAALTEIQHKSAQQAKNGQNRNERRCKSCNENTHLQRCCPYPKMRNRNYPPPLLGSNYSSNNQSNLNGPFNAQPANIQSTVGPAYQNTGRN